MEHGQIVEEGVPADLVVAGGRFATLVELDVAGWMWQDVDVETSAEHTQGLHGIDDPL